MFAAPSVCLFDHERMVSGKTGPGSLRQVFILALNYAPARTREKCGGVSLQFSYTGITTTSLTVIYRPKSRVGRCIPPGAARLGWRSSNSTHTLVSPISHAYPGVPRVPELAYERGRVGEFVFA